jgi:hypothetical protein
MKKRFNTITIILIVFLAIRAFMQIVLMFIQKDILLGVIFIFFATLYLVALLGVSLKRKFGSILTIIIAIIDLLFALVTGGGFGLGAGVIDLILIFLGYKEYHQIK